MADIYVSSSTGNDTYGTGTQADPIKTIPQAMLLGATTIYLFEDTFSYRFTPSRIVTGIGNNKTIFDGTGVSGVFTASKTVFTNVIVQNFADGVASGSGLKYNFNNSILRNNGRLGIGQNDTGTFNLLCYNNTKNSSDNFGFENNTINNFKYHTYHNGFHWLQNANCGSNLAYHIYSDYELKITTTCTLQYSLFYGNCKIWDGVSAYVSIDTISDLTTYGNGTYTGCKVLPNISGAVTDNGSGFLRITKVAHGLMNGEEITIRVGHESYLAPRVAIKLIDVDTFDIESIDYVFGYSVLEYNEPLFVNEWEGNFNVWTDSIATKMNASDAYTPIGYGKMCIPYTLDKFTTKTNLIETAEIGYDTVEINDDGDNGTLDDGSIVLFDEPTNISGFGISEQTDYTNGRYLSATAQLSEDIYAEGVTLPNEYVKVEIGAVIYNTNTYNVDDVFLASGGTFTTTDSGIVRAFNPNQNERQATVNLKIKHGDVWSDDLLIILGTEGEIVNYQDNDPATQKITYGNGDADFDSGNAFGLYAISGVQYLENTLQNGDRSAVV